jgi:hypothetical protein
MAKVTTAPETAVCVGSDLAAPSQAVRKMGQLSHNPWIPVRHQACPSGTAEQHSLSLRRDPGGADTLREIRTRTAWTAPLLLPRVRWSGPAGPTHHASGN